MSFSFSILWSVMKEDQVHIGTSSLRDQIAATTPTNQATTTIHELYGDLCEYSCVIDCLCKSIFYFSYKKT
jgi:hypothetical protein